MAGLLIHSMAELDDLVVGSLEIAGAARVVEIGVEGGRMSQALMAHTAGRGGALTGVDPSPGPEAEALYGAHRHARLVRATSLEAIPQIDGDAWLVDGDHNYYTVLNECRAVAERARAARVPFLAFFHDVGWPWARRDLYYDPARIPPEHRHPHTFEHGVTLDHAGVIEGGFRGEGGWACALHEGGPRNGVLTAVEDFAAGHDHLAWAFIPAVFGLGVLFDRRAPWADRLIAGLAPYHRHPLLERLERNRLECYLAVIEWQDRAARDPAAGAAGA
jgi:hypothetical protein